jgi:hypothetical protein
MSEEDKKVVMKQVSNFLDALNKLPEDNRFAGATKDLGKSLYIQLNGMYTMQCPACLNWQKGCVVGCTYKTGDICSETCSSFEERGKKA